MSKPLRYGLLAAALFLGWSLFGERLNPLIRAGMAPIEQGEYSASRGDPDAVTTQPPEGDRVDTPDISRRSRISDHVREKVKADLERGARRNGP